MAKDKRLTFGTFDKPSIIERFEYALEKRDEYWSDNAALNFSYYDGTGHWSADEVAKLNKEERPITKINLIFKAINTMSGNEIQNRNDMFAFPVEGGDVKMANIVNHGLKYIKRKNNMPWHFTQSVVDGFISGQGWIKNSVRPDPNGEMKIVVKKKNPLVMYFDPASVELDLSDCHDIHESIWLDIEEISARWPDKAQDIKSFSTAAGKDRVDVYYNRDRNLGRVIYSEFREWKRVTRYQLQNNETGEVEWFDQSRKPGWKQLKKLPVIRPSVKGVWHFGSIQLEEEITNPHGCGDENFSYTGVFPYFVNGEGVSAVEQVRSVQDVVNKSYSQALDILNRQQKTGGFYEKGAVDNAEKLKEVSESGNWIEVKDVNKIKEGELPQYPHAHMQTMGDSINLSDSVLGLTEVFQGDAPGRVESGIGIQILRKQAGLPFEGPSDNLRWAMIEVERKLIKQFSEFWSRKKFMRLTGESGYEDVYINGPSITVSSLDKDGNVEKEETFDNKLKDVEYDLALDVNAPSVTQRQFNQILGLEIFRQLPDPRLVPLLIDLMDFPNKDQWKQTVENVGNDTPGTI